MVDSERKFSEDNSLTDQAIPIPIQVFLWKQVSPFVKPKLGRLHEASCIFCQSTVSGHHELKEACKYFEKVLVQNIQSGLDHDLAESLRSLPRWRLIQSALPHVLHCTASLLFNRMKDGNIQTFGAAETKLLYTLHWIILDAAEECADADFELGIYHSSPFYYLFSIPTITLFIYLFAPLCHQLKESDFQNFRLELGLKIWQAMWEFRHPEAPCFTTPVRPKPRHLSGKNAKNKMFFCDVFLGRKPSQDDTLGGGGTKESPQSMSGMGIGASASSSDLQHFLACSSLPPSTSTVTGSSGTPAPVTVTATITKPPGTVTTALDEETGWVSSPKDTVFPETIPEESSSNDEEHVVIFCLPSLNDSDGLLRDPSIYTAETSIFQLSVKNNGGTKTSVRVEPVVTPTTAAEPKLPKPSMQKIGSSTDKDSVDSSKHPSTEGPGAEGPPTGHSGRTLIAGGHPGDLTAATFLDVAVLRCLFITNWQEEGIYWALHYLYNRLRDISEESSCVQQPRRRSNSLPIPKIEISLYQSPEGNKGENKDFIEVPEVKDVSILSESPYHGMKNSEESVHVRRSSEKTKRRTKIADLKTFVETKLLSKSDKALEKIGQEEQKLLGEQQAVGSRRLFSVSGEYHRSLDTGDEQLRNRRSEMSQMFDPFPSNLVKGKSMPSLRYIEPTWDKRRISRLGPTQPMANPIITVTEHTPTPSPDYLRRQGSMDSQLDATSLPGSKQGGMGGTQERKASLTRSQTDSNITYAADEMPEAPGSACYITKDGDIDFHVVLKAVYRSSLREAPFCTLRVLEVILNLVELLMDMGVLKQCLREEHANAAANMEGTAGNSASGTKSGKVHAGANLTDGDGKVVKPMTTYRLIIGAIVRVLKLLGCPHGCSEGQRGPAAEFLRTQCQNILAKLSRASARQFKSFLREHVKTQPLIEVLDFFHAYVGFCVDPSSLLSPLNQKRGSSRSPTDTVTQCGIGTSRVDAGVGAGGIRGVEGQIVSHTFKPLVTRFVDNIKELKSQENLGMFCEVRQLMIYVKEGHGSTFRRVALSALIDTADRATKKDNNIQTTRVIRHMHHSEIDDQADIVADSPYPLDERGVRKLLFKKRSTSSTCASLLETEAEEFSRISQSPLGNIRKKHHILTPRQSERALGITDPIIIKPKSRSRLGGIVKWFKKGDQESCDMLDSQDNGESLSDAASFIRQSNKYYTQKQNSRSVSQTLQKAKKRVEDRFNKYVLKKGKTKDGSLEESSGGYLSRKNSMEFGESSRESEFVVLKERKLVPTGPVYNGMLRFSFLLETCHPGSVPDPHLLASIIDLPHSAIVARASMLLECSYFVHLCNKGQWPSWMKLNFPMFRPSGPLPVRGHATTGIRRSHIMQRAAGKMFYQWAEALGQRLEEIINEDKKLENHVNSMVTDEQKQKELLIQDEEEDYLDEASIYSYGSSCPMALKMLACVLLHEITGFLRETYQTLPKSSRGCTAGTGTTGAKAGMGGGGGQQTWDKNLRDQANRRWSMALSSMGHSQTSAQSLQSIAGDRGETGQTERKISFVLHEPDNESEGSSNTTLTMQAMLASEECKRLGQPPRPYLLRRGTTAPSGGSFKRRSLKLRRGTKEGKDMENECLFIASTKGMLPDTVKRADSIQSKRKVSSLSDRSDTSEPGCANAGDASGGEESPGVLSDDQPPESPSDSNDTDETAKHMPWMRAMTLVTDQLYYYCLHQGHCHPYCYRRVMRACGRLVKAVRKVYGEEFGVTDDRLLIDMGSKNKNKTGAGGKKDKQPANRKVSDQQYSVTSQLSPVRRKDSVAKKDKIDKNLDGSQMSKLASKDSSRDIAESDSGQETLKPESESKPKETPPILKYIRTQVKDGFHAPLACLLKGACILAEEQFLEIIPIAWELLLESNQEVVACAASLFILAAVKAPQQVSDLMQHGLAHPDTNTRINAILRFQVLWKMRYQVWPRMEEGAHVLFKVPPPGIEFTLPSPKIGIESLDVVDSPWQLQVKTKVEEVTINQERHRSLVTATKTRKKQQTELIKMALQAQDDKKREERENFLITTIPITLQAAHEPSLYHTSEDHEEDDDGQVDAGPSRTTSHPLHSAHSLFPSCLCSAMVQIINLLDDAAVSPDGNSVYEVAYQVIWCCLVEDSGLCLRYILERLTRERQEQMFKILRHLIRFIPKLPQQAAFALYNYIIGYVMFYVRSPHEEGQHLIGAALSLLWMVVHSVHGIMFKDLKQILRKEQCDASILLTANVPSAKKIIVHGPQDEDEGGIPSQFPVQEDTQFCQILKESLDFFDIDEHKHNEYFLVDHKTHQIRNPSAYVRDYYFFKRSQYPQLELVHMKPESAFNALQKQELVHKFVEIGKVLLTWAILKNVDMVVQRVVFLHEELMKLPSFPRKALESNLELYRGGELGKELLGLDVLHKFMWVRLIARMFEAMAGNFAYSSDIHLFLNVLNGAFVLHSEDACILRYVMATYINAAFHFKNIFSTNGYLLIMPTLLKIYSNHQTNRLVTTTVEYAVKQFYMMNRKPFILQMFGSVSAMLDTDEEGTFGDAHKIQSSCLFNLLLSLETPSPDPLNIAELVKEDKPLKAIDFCYHDENEMVTILDCISLCVMVVSYSSESVRGYQMLIILEAILPCYVQHIQLPSYNKEGKTEKEIINQLAVAIKTLVNNCESLTKSYNGPYRSSPEHKGSSQRNYSRGGPYSPGFDFEDESHSKFMSEHSRAKSMYEHDVEDSEVLRAEYRRPRDVLLSLVGEFMCRATSRLQELNKKNNQEGKLIELLDIRSHIRLADIAHSLLKVSPYDPESMGCRGLQHYMSYILPSTEWANDAMRPALVTILRRLDKVFQKISKKPSIRRNTDWDAAAGLLKGIYDTMMKYPYIMHWQHIKQLINTCQSLIVSDTCMEGVSSATAALMSQAPPQHFCSMVVRLIALQIQNTADNCNLEQVCGGSSVFPSQEKTESIIMNLIMPLCIRVGSGRKDVTAMKQSDISFALTIILHAVCPPSTKSVMSSGPNLKTVEIRTGSLTFTGTRDTKMLSKINTSLYQVAFLALKIMTICFEGELMNDWTRISRTMRDLSKRNEASSFLWDFLDFVVTHRTTLFIMMQPFIFQKLAQPPISDFERNMHQRIRDKMRSIGLPFPKSRGALLMELAQQMKQLKEDLEDASESMTDPGKGGNKETTVQMTSETHGKPRHSLIGLFTGGQDTHKQTPTQANIPEHAPLSNQANLKESSTSTSHVSTPNQVTMSDCHDQQNVTGTSTPCNAATDRSSQRSSSVSDDHGLPSQPLQKSESFISHKAHKLRFVSSVEFRHSSGETSTTPLSPGSPADESSGESSHPNRPPRLQRIKPQSRKTFRLRRSKKSTKQHPTTTANQASKTQQCQEPSKQSPQSPADPAPAPTKTFSQAPTPVDSPTATITPPKTSPPPPPPVGTTVDPHHLRIATRQVRGSLGEPSGGSWDEDSMISQTSSTSGYRESYPTTMVPREPLEPNSRAFPPLASPDVHSTSSAATINNCAFNSSPDACSLNGDGLGSMQTGDEGWALLGDDHRVSSQHSLVMMFADRQDEETTLI